MRRTLIRICFSLLPAIVGVSCGLSQPFPQKGTFALQVPPPASLHKPPATQAALIVGSVRVNRPYDGASFIYRVGPAQFSTDYYNGFVGPPERLLAGDLTAWLSSSGLFTTVGEPGWTTNYRFIVRAHVLELYGDWRDKKSPTAILAVKLYFIDDIDASEHVLFQKVYRQEEPLKRDDAAELVAGWERAWQRILSAIVADIRAQLAESISAN